MKRQLPSQLLEQQFFSLATRRAPLSESIQLGAQLMLQKAVELEVAEFLGRDHYQRQGGVCSWAAATVTKTSRSRPAKVPSI